MRRKLLGLLVLLLQGVAVQMYAQLSVGDVIRCVPAQDRCGVVAEDDVQAYPLGGIDMNTPDPKTVDGKTFFEVFFTITSVEDKEVALGCSSQYITEQRANGIIQQGYFFTRYSYSEETLLKSSYTEGGTTVASIIIPAKIRVGSDDYTVTSIGNYAFKFGGQYSRPEVGESSKFGSQPNEKLWVYLPSTITKIGEQGTGGYVSYWDVRFYDVETDGTPKRDSGISATSDEQKLAKDFVCGDAYNNVKTIGKEAFKFCQGLTTLPAGSSTTSIGKEAFAYAFKEGIEKLTFPDLSNLTNIGEQAFQYANFTSLDLLASRIKEIGDKMFQACPNLKEVVLPSNLEIIGDNAFHGCVSLTKITWPGNTLRIIGGDAFQNCNLQGEMDINALGANPALTIGSGAFANNRFTYLKLEQNGPEIHKHAFGSQKSEFTVEFDEKCTTVPDYIKECPFSHAETYEADGNEYLSSLRVIVPISCVGTYHKSGKMSYVDEGDYRVKFRWGTFTDYEALKNELANSNLEARSYYNLYNITPQQRLIATSAWKNDVLNFRAQMKVDDLGFIKEAKATDFDDDTPLPGKTMRKKHVVHDNSGYYNNTVDYWDPTTHEATVIDNDDDFFGETTWAFNKATFDKDSDEAKNEGSYPQSLMPYSIHTFHANHGIDDEPAQIGRKAVKDGIVPPNTGIVIDFPKPGYYLVPPAVKEESWSKWRWVYPVDKDGNFGEAFWYEAPEIYGGEQAEDTCAVPFWWDRRNSWMTHEETENNYYYFMTEEEINGLNNLCTGLFTVLTDPDLGDSFPDNYILNESALETIDVSQKEALMAIIKQVELRNDTVQNFYDWAEVGVDYYMRDIEGESVKCKIIGNPYEEGMPLLTFSAGENDKIKMLEDFIKIRIKLGDIQASTDGSYTLTKNGKTYTTKETAMYTVHLPTDYPNGAYPSITLTRDVITKNGGEYEGVSFTNNKVEESESDLLERIKQFYENNPGKTLYWVDIDSKYTDVVILHQTFINNHNSNTDHNVIIGLPDQYPLWPYWAESPYPFQDAAHDVAHSDIKERFNIVNEGDELNPLNFKYDTYGRMGKGNTFVNIKDVEDKKATLDSDIHYVNFVVSKGYFVQVKSKPSDANKTQTWVPANRAYFSVSRNHMPHLFKNDNSNDGKLAISIIPEDNGGTTGITTIDSGTTPRANDYWYTLQGVRLDSKPTHPGIYIHKGRKEAVR